MFNSSEAGRGGRLKFIKSQFINIINWKLYSISLGRLCGESGYNEQETLWDSLDFSSEIWWIFEIILRSSVHMLTKLLAIGLGLE